MFRFWKKKTWKEKWEKTSVTKKQGHTAGSFLGLTQKKLSPDSDSIVELVGVIDETYKLRAECADWSPSAILFEHLEKKEEHSRTI